MVGPKYAVPFDPLCQDAACALRASLEAVLLQDGSGVIHAFVVWLTPGDGVVGSERMKQSTETPLPSRDLSALE